MRRVSIAPGGPDTDFVHVNVIRVRVRHEPFPPPNDQRIVMLLNACSSHVDSDPFEWPSAVGA